MRLIIGSIIGFIIGSNSGPIIESIMGVVYVFFGLVIGQGLETLVVGYLSYFV